MVTRRFITGLLYAAVVFPIALCVTFGVAELLAAMADHAWAQVLHRMCLLGAVAWVVNLICLLVALAVHAAAEGHSSGDSTDQ